MNDKLTIAWCDNGMVDGKFMQGVTDIMLHSGVEIVTTLRSQGNQIARQRERVVNHWYESNKSDWLLWVDSDVVISPEKFKLLWDNRDVTERPMVSGVYFTTDTPEEPLMEPMPTIFWFVENGEEIGIKRVHPMPKNKLLKVGAAGMGFVIMHRSVIEKLKEVEPDFPIFSDAGHGTKFMGEDIYFFARCAQAGIPLYAHTGATVPHMKRFSFDEPYYDVFVGNKRK